MSPIAVIMGLATVELAVEAVPSALAREPVFKLGVRDIGRSEDAEVLCWSVEGRSMTRLRPRTGVDGLISVSMRRGAQESLRELG